MILLDPDLDPDRRSTIPRGTNSPELPKVQRDSRPPSPRTLNAFLREAQQAVRLKGIVSVLLTTDAAIRTLNRDFRRKNKATDVLSFPASEVSRGEVAGDLAISVDTARLQARDHGHSLSTEIKVLILHGLLHLAGYDHEKDSGVMARRERTLRAKLALPLGLIERTTKNAFTLSTPGRGRGGKQVKTASLAGPRAVGSEFVSPALQRGENGPVKGSSPVGTTPGRVARRLRGDSQRSESPRRRVEGPASQRPSRGRTRMRSKGSRS
ncbi:MAG TPA: rRNA maturation RNase YbeY [Terracidiphilus sp.]|nr:rRNA maturation RNase YbeY [Terracidiphilus sp.]